MKKKLIAIFTLTAIPVFASCPIDKPCTAVILNDANLPLQQRLIPDRLENLKKTDAFQPKYVTPYEDMLINTEQPSEYNSNCQFGVCLPERTQENTFAE